MIYPFLIMPNHLFRKFIRDSVDGVIKKAQRASGVDHPGMIGEIREEALKDIFRPILTDVADVGYGKITDYVGHLSKETDLIIYSKDINPPILYDTGGARGIFPAETCLYSIEVKSKTSSNEIKDAIKKARVIREMQYSPGFYDNFGNAPSHSITPIVTVFFSFSSDLTGKSELERYLVLDPEGNTDPLIRAICVVGSGYWYFYGHEQCWYYWEPTDDYEEVVAFLGGIINTIPDAIASRGRPRFGEYIIDKKGRKIL